jgi:hypothetical protein
MPLMAATALTGLDTTIQLMKAIPWWPILIAFLAWMYDKVCSLAGVPGRLVHDFRRTAVRNLERAGVPRSAAMKLTGHKTDAVYRRYAITHATMLQEAAAKLDAFLASKMIAVKSLAQGDASHAVSPTQRGFGAITSGTPFKKLFVSNMFLVRARVAEWQTRRT